MTTESKNIDLSAAALEALPQAIAILDTKGTVVQVNRAWRNLEAASGGKRPGDAVCGENYLDRWRSHLDHQEQALALAAALKEISLQGQPPSDFQLDYSVPGVPGQKYFRLHLFPTGAVGNHILLIREDVTAEHIRSLRARTLLSVDEALALRDNTESMAERALGMLHEAARATISALFLWEESERAFKPQPFIGGTKEDRQILSGIRLGRDQNFAELMRKERGVMCHNMNDQDFLPISLWQPLRIGQFIAAPLHTDNQVLGVLLLARDSNESLLERHQLRLSRAVARRLAYGLENANLVKALGAASRLKSEFVATMSHELRTPLHVVLGYADLMLDEAFGSVNDEQRDSLRRIERSGAALLELINETLNLSQLDSGEMPMALEEIDLRQLFERIAAEGAVPHAAAGVDYQTQISDDLPLIFSDRGKIEVIVRNLLSNAFKFTTDGFVLLRAEETQDGICFSIRDTGEGMTADTLNFVFEPFRQGADPLTRKVGGAGLGLHLVERYVELLGGTIDATSEPGQGSLFTVRLPLRLRTLAGTKP